MRAWLLLLTVLATFQTIVRVASTEDNNISEAFITTIKPAKEDLNYVTTAIIPKPSTALVNFVDFDTDRFKEQLKEEKIIIYTPHKIVSEEVQHKNQNHSDLDKNIIIEIKNINEIDDRSDFESEVVEKNYKIVNHKQSEEIKDQNNKMALQESGIEKQSQEKENQKTTQQNKMHSEEDIKLNKENSSSTYQHHHHHHHHHHHPQHTHHLHQHKHKSQPASQQHQQTTSGNLTLSSSSNYNSIPTQTKSLTLLPTVEEVKDALLPSPPVNNYEDLEVSIMENEDGAISVESQQPQLDAVLPDEGPRTFSNQEIIAEKVKPDPATLVEIEKSLLSLFNMKRPPKIDRSKIVIPEAMKQMYEQMTGQELNSVNIPRTGLLTKSANTVRSFTHQDSEIDDRFPHHHRFRLYFDINSIPGEEKLKAAELQLSRDAISLSSLNSQLANLTRYQVLVYDITRVGVKGKREPSYLLLDNKTIRLNSTDTVSLDVQPAVDRWLASPKQNFGLLIEVRTSYTMEPAPHHHVRLRRSADEKHEVWERKKPLLLTYTDDGRQKSRAIRDVSTRSKRAGGHHRRTQRRKNGEEICRRHPLYVDFADVGWSDWIVAPPGYDAFYCSGRCPFPIAEHLNSTNHAVVQTLVNSINPGKAPKACCVPTQLEGISMLYLNDHNSVVLKNYQDMTVVGCGCR